MKRPSGSASIKIPLEVIPDCRYVSVLVENARVHGYVLLCIKFLSNGTKSSTLKYFVVKKILLDTPRDENILP